MSNLFYRLPPELVSLIMDKAVNILIDRNSMTLTIQQLNSRHLIEEFLPYPDEKKKIKVLQDFLSMIDQNPTDNFPFSHKSDRIYYEDGTLEIDNVYYDKQTSQKILNVLRGYLNEITPV